MSLSFATLGNGCFWCTEAIFGRLKGVQSVVSGYSGGHVDHPTYEAVCSGTTGHAECLHIQYDSALITYAELLEVFWNTHDPTTLNRQGEDVGTQYRSVVFYHDEEQRLLAETYKKQVDASGIWHNPVVTQIEPFRQFFPAEDYHQQYLERRGGTNPYCQVVVRPKVEKFMAKFHHMLR